MLMKNNLWLSAMTVLVLAISILQTSPGFTQNEVSSENSTVNTPTNTSPIVVLETTKGNIELKLFPDIAPKASENFSRLATRGYYNGIIFHRVIPGFMIQGGDPTGTGSGGQSVWDAEFEDEFSPTVEFNRPGILAMANRGPNTNGSQFFITTVATPHLNMHHTIFGEVVSGMDVVQAIEQSPTAPGDRPVEDIKILKAYVK